MKEKKSRRTVDKETKDLISDILADNDVIQLIDQQLDVTLDIIVNFLKENEATLKNAYDNPKSYIELYEDIKSKNKFLLQSFLENLPCHNYCVIYTQLCKVFPEKDVPAKIKQFAAKYDEIRKMFEGEFIMNETLESLAFALAKNSTLYPDSYKELVSEFEKQADDNENAKKIYDFLKSNNLIPIDVKTVIAKKTKEIGYPIDKVNSTIWEILSEDLDGQLTFPIKAESSIDAKKGKEINIYYTIQFEAIEGLKITKNLNAYDKRVYIAIGALFNAGNEVVTLNQIYYAMGNTSKPSKTQLDKINGAVTKMRNATIYLDNGEEIEANYKYPRFKYDGSLLPMERVAATINGQTTETAIHLFREPPVISFAKKRSQITTFDVKLLQSPINKTDSNLKLEDYLLERIAKAKNAAKKTKKKTEKILYKTIYEHCNFTNRMQKSRAPETIRRYLDYYKSVQYITGYNMKDPESIIVTL